MKKLLITSLVMFFLCSNIQAQDAKAKNSAELKWYTPAEAFKLQKKHPKKIFMDVYTNWCGWCKRMDANTFSNPEVIEVLNKYYYCVKFNAEGQDTFEWNGITYQNEGKYGKTHTFAVTILNGKLSYPTTTYFDEKSQLITNVAGYLTPEQFIPIITFFGDDAYKTKSYEEFSAEFAKSK